jgi:hypothetical protein
MTDHRIHMLRIPQRIRDGLEPIARRNHRTSLSKLATCWIDT